MTRQSCSLPVLPFIVDLTFSLEIVSCYSCFVEHFIDLYSINDVAFDRFKRGVYRDTWSVTSLIGYISVLFCENRIHVSLWRRLKNIIRCVIRCYLIVKRKKCDYKNRLCLTRQSWFQSKNLRTSSTFPRSYWSKARSFEVTVPALQFSSIKSPILSIKMSPRAGFRRQSWISRSASGNRQRFPIDRVAAKPNGKWNRIEPLRNGYKVRNLYAIACLQATITVCSKDSIMHSWI